MLSIRVPTTPGATSTFGTEIVSTRKAKAQAHRGRQIALITSNAALYSIAPTAACPLTAVRMPGRHARLCRVVALSERVDVTSVEAQRLEYGKWRGAVIERALRHTQTMRR